MANIPYSQAGVAELNTDSFTQVELMAGDTPPIVTDYGLLGTTLDDDGIPAWTPVFVDPATRAITLAVIDSVTPANSVFPNAITIVAIAPGTASTSKVPVYKAGMFNMNALNWPASFDTDAERASAFAKGADAAGGANQIYVKKPVY